MGITALCICIICLVASLLLFRNRLVSPVSFFFALWSLVVFLSLIGLYDMKEPSGEVYFLLMLMVVCFFAGSVAYERIPGRKEDKSIVGKVCVRWKIFYILLVMLVLVEIFDAGFMLSHCLNGTQVTEYRNWVYEPWGSRNPVLDRRSLVEEAFRTLVLSPFGALVHPTAAYIFFDRNETRRRRYGLCGISLLHLVLGNISSGGGRLALIYYIGCFLLAFLVFLQEKKITESDKKKYGILAGFAILAGMGMLLANTIARSGTGMLLKHAYTYFAMPPTLLSEWLPTLKEATHTYGMLTFFGVHSYFFRTLHMIGLDSLVPDIYYEAYRHVLNANEFYELGFGTGNAFVTPVYYLFIDGGYLFVCIVSAGFGGVIAALYHRLAREMNIRNFTLYIIMMYGVFVSFMRVSTVIPGYWIEIIAALLLYKKVRKET